MPDYMEFHRSVTEELYSVKNRIRNLVSHWPTDGEFKEAALRSVLRRHLPDSFLVGRGFVVTPTNSSTQIDILIVDSGKPTLFREGDLLIVTPDAVRAVIEVKTDLRSRAAVGDALKNLMKVEDMCRDLTGRDSCWTGLFAFNETSLGHEVVLNAVSDSYAETRRPINCISLGKDSFVRYWTRGADVNGPERGPVWHTYTLPGVAPSYFIGNLIDHLTSADSASAGYAWFPLIGGKEEHRQWFLPQGSVDPRTF